MSNYKGLFTFDEDSHKYIPISIAGAEGIIDAVGQKPAEPLIKDEKIRKAVRAWAEANDFVRVFYKYDYSNDEAVFMVVESKMTIESDELLDDSRNYTIAELCGEEEE